MFDRSFNITIEVYYSLVIVAYMQNLPDKFFLTIHLSSGSYFISKLSMCATGKEMSIIMMTSSKTQSEIKVYRRHPI
jgi:hypothetical protein